MVTATYKLMGGFHAMYNIQKLSISGQIFCLFQCRVSHKKRSGNNLNADMCEYIYIQIFLSMFERSSAAKYRPLPIWGTACYWTVGQLKVTQRKSIIHGMHWKLASSVWISEFSFKEWFSRFKNVIFYHFNRFSVFMIVDITWSDPAGWDS